MYIQQLIMMESPNIFVMSFSHYFLPTVYICYCLVVQWGLKAHWFGVVRVYKACFSTDRFSSLLFLYDFHFTCMYKTMIFSCDQFCRQLNYTCLILKSLAPICFLAETNLMNNTLWIEKMCYKKVFFVLLKKKPKQLNKKTITTE